MTGGNHIHVGVFRATHFHILSDKYFKIFFPHTRWSQKTNPLRAAAGAADSARVGTLLALLTNSRMLGGKTIRTDNLGQYIRVALVLLWICFGVLLLLCWRTVAVANWVIVGPACTDIAPLGLVAGRRLTATRRGGKKTFLGIGSEKVSNRID